MHHMVLAVVNASAVDDRVLADHHRQMLREFCEAETHAGRGSGFMWEALADLTHEPAERVSRYEKALELSHANGEPFQTILLELGRCCFDAADWKSAGNWLMQARDQAICMEDLDTEGDAVVLLLRIPEECEGA
ncbi:MAG: hypothetical protein QM755_21140 [Luteolibacter sp.]